ncbi:transketolase family protein, partial [Morganella morganii]
QLPRPINAIFVPAYEFTHSSNREALRRQYAIDAAGLHAQLTP